MLINKDKSIQLIRVFAMLMIIFDHICCIISFPMQSIIVQVLNSGVFIFVFISGLLYGNKNVHNWKDWFKKRLIRICIPLWIFMTIDFIIESIIWDVFDVKYVLIYALNLQGIFGVNMGGTNLWFLTLIMVCYLITPILQWIKNKNPNRNMVVLSLAGAIILQVVLAYTTDIGMVAGHTLSWCIIAVGMYVAGYFAGNIILPNDISVKRISFVTLLSAISSAVVLVFNYKFDGQVIYDRIVIFYGMIIIDFWICTVLYKMGKHIKYGVWIGILNHLDKISYEFYIVHGLIIAAVTQPLIEMLGVVAYMCVTIILSYIGAWVLHGVCSLVYRKVQ